MRTVQLLLPPDSGTAALLCAAAQAVAATAIAAMLAAGTHSRSSISSCPSSFGGDTEFCSFVLSAVTASLVTTLLLAVLQLAKGERWGVLASLLQLLIGWAGLLLWLTAAVVATERSAVAGAQAPGFRRALCIAVAWLVAAFTASQACAAWELLHSGMCGCSRVEAYWVAALDGPNAPGGSSCGRGGRGGGSGRGLPTYKRLARADRLACIVEESTSDLEECLSPPTEGDELSCSCGAGSCNPACPAWSPAPAGHSADASVAAGAAGGKGGAAERPSGAVPQPLVHAHSE